MIANKMKKEESENSEELKLYISLLKNMENILNKAKIKAYSKISLEKPLSKSGLKDWKEAIKEYYGYTNKEMEDFLK